MEKKLPTDDAKPTFVSMMIFVVSMKKCGDNARKMAIGPGSREQKSIVKHISKQVPNKRTTVPRITTNPSFPPAAER